MRNGLGVRRRSSESLPDPIVEPYPRRALEESLRCRNPSYRSGSVSSASLAKAGWASSTRHSSEERRGARVAVKTIRNLTADSISRFKREFRALADVHHPNVISLGELFSEGADWFFSMELVEGDDFLAYVRPAEARWRAVEALTEGTVSSVRPRGPAVSRSPSHLRLPPRRRRRRPRLRRDPPSVGAAPARRRAGRPSRGRRRSSRRQAVEHPADARGAAGAPGLRAGDRPGEGPFDRDGDEDGRNAGLHGAGAGAVGRRRAGGGLVRRRRSRLRSAHGRRAVRGGPARDPDEEAEPHGRATARARARGAGRSRRPVRRAPPVRPGGAADGGAHPADAGGHGRDRARLPLVARRPGSVRRAQGRARRPVRRVA